MGLPNDHYYDVECMIEGETSHLKRELRELRERLAAQPVRIDELDTTVSELFGDLARLEEQVEALLAESGPKEG
jgi:uncharacterized coiled-coil protein SlyX